MERTVYCDDALDWLSKNIIIPHSSMVASLPDISEFPHYTLAQWKTWFIDTAKLILSKTSDEGVSVFFQSDIKLEGTWVDKGYLCQKAAEELGHHLLWHKIACRAPAGVITFGRPAYSHILCFSKNNLADISRSSADVLPDLGDKSWERGMGIEACLMVAKFIKEQTTSKVLINPFCGHGSMLAAADYVEMNSIGIERSPKRVEKAKTLRVNDSQRPLTFT